MVVQLETLLGSAILVVDDEPANVALLTHMLEGEGYTNIVSTTDSRQVIDLHNRYRFDLILLDMRMPHMSGLDVLRLMTDSNEWDATPVIVLTAQADDKTREEALKAGAHDFLSKPLRHWEVLLRIRNVLRTRHYYKEIRKYAEELESLVQERTKKIYETQLTLIGRLGNAGDKRNNVNGNHILRVSRSCEAVARAIGMPEAQVELIRLASPVHDVGKIGIPDNVLMKQGALNPEERAIMNRHAIIGSEIMGDHGDEVMSMATIMARYHHEKWDGSGYPYGLKGPGIPLPARIAAICDVYDALTSDRPYKPAWNPQDALVYIQEQAGHHFDPEVVRAFSSAFSVIAALRDQYPD